MSNDILIGGVSVRFGKFTALDNLDLHIGSGEFFSILGPSGCGKTTLLRAISGFQRVSEGTIKIGGQDMTHTDPKNRPTALIFQNLALFPFLSVRDNVAFGLEAQGESKAERYKTADRCLGIVDLPGMGDRAISQLSGGQKQRVAIARALAIEPQVLLLDEPLSALDLKLRIRMRTELRAIQKRAGITFVYITHDQGEALTMSDRIAVMKDGVLHQVGPPDEVYRNPATPFVAGFVGESNFLPGQIVQKDGQRALQMAFGDVPISGRSDLAVGSEANLQLRPESLTLGANKVTVPVRLVALEREGSMRNLKLETQTGHRLSMVVLSDEMTTFQGRGDWFDVGFDPANAHVLAGRVEEDVTDA